MKKFNYDFLSDIISKNKIISEFTNEIKNFKEQLNIKTINGSLISLLIDIIKKTNNKNIAVFCPNSDFIENISHDLNLINNNTDLAIISNKQKKKYAITDKAIENNDIFDGISRLKTSENFIALINANIINNELPKPDTISENLLKIKINEYIEFDDFIKSLMLNGFERVNFVSQHGEIAIRGSIVDIFPFGWENPIRIEFFGNEIESIREFDSLSQRSIKKYDDIEFISKVFDSNDDSKYNIFDYLDKDILVIVINFETILSLVESFAIPSHYKTIYFNKFEKSDFEIHSEKQNSFRSLIKIFSTELRKLTYDGYKIILSAEGKIHTERFKDLVSNALISEDNIEEDENNLLLADPKITLNNIQWLDNSLAEGFIFKDSKIAFFTEHQVFERQRLKDANKLKKSATAFTLSELKQLKIGDYVVHEDKGIAKFDGFENVLIGGSYQDCAKLIFADSDKLYVHLNYIHKIQKYSAQEGAIPKLSKLGSSEWNRKKERTKKRLKDIARNLILLYAKRKIQKGFAFPSDTLWQKELEASFIYEDTPDQAKTTIDVKKDMESSSPMDRLVCGDVGFGKTEIAVRAAFKAVQAGKQVAVLVPTTVLAQQHYMTFKDRLSRYPVLIESLSRFKTKSQQNDTLEKLKNGKLDIVIGTHRLISKDVNFKDIGLLIIDEEHRFGVAAKEKIREIKANIDTLTLTATPIPRTLNFSLMGARDLSVIETPPRNRLPVDTQIMIWDLDEIKNIINKEISRKGQVFFVNDKIEDLEKIKMDLEMVLPTVKFAIAHGQMPPNIIESTMEKFIERKIDVLLSTKIIESGIDIPNANTMIINRAQNFGLAELYQLRGRVGRSNTQAYCYLLIPQGKILGTNGIRRLQAIEEFTDLGSGLQLAMRDMEIRGAGDLLGAEQSGFIADIGFELFHKILDEAVIELKSEEFKDLFREQEISNKNILYNEDLSIELESDALLPFDYISNDSERFMYYKKLYNVKNNQDLKALSDEIIDKYGKPPKKVTELFFAVKLRIAALSSGFTKIIVKPHVFYCEFPNDNNKDYYNEIFPLLTDYIDSMENARITEIKKKLYLEFKINSRDETIEILWRIKKYLESYLE